MKELISYIVSRDGFRKFIRERVTPKLRLGIPDIPNLVWKALLRS
jgi:hypothetical protein